MTEMPHPGDTVTIQLERHDETREVRVKRVHVQPREMTIVYPGTAPGRGRIFGDIEERVSWDAIVKRD